jgi:hypothetical protein
VSTGEGGEGNGRGSGSRSTLSGPVQSTREVFRGNRVGGLRMPVATHRTRHVLEKRVRGMICRARALHVMVRSNGVFSARFARKWVC